MKLLCLLLISGSLLASSASTCADETKATVSLDDMKLLQVYFEAASGVSGRLPDKSATLAALKMEKGAANLVKAIEQSTLILTGPVEREGVWAFESNATVNGGFVLSNNGIEKLDAASARRRLGK